MVEFMLVILYYIIKGEVVIKEKLGLVVESLLFISGFFIVVVVRFVDEFVRA